MPPPEAVRVLIIEDNAATAVLQKRALERAGYETMVANSVQEAVDAIRRQPVHVVLLDNRLPGHMTGIDFLPTLKSLAPEVPVIMVTGSEMEGAVIRALRGGVRDFIRKDINYLESLPKAVAGVLESATLEAQLQGNWTAADCPVLLIGEAGGDKETLEGTGFRVFPAQELGQALRILGEQDINLIVIESDSSPRPGVEMYRLLRSSGHDVPAVLVSAIADEAGLLEAMRAGFIDFVHKSGDYSASLREAVHRAAERLCLESRLEESRKRLAGIVNSAMDAILLLDEHYNVVMFNPAAERLFQVSAPEAVQQPVTRFIPQLTDELAAQHAAPGAPSKVATRGVGKGGKEAELEVAITPMESAGRRFFTVIARDVTERNELQRRLLQKDKLESLGLLAGGIAHDFNNLLVGIMGNSSLALETVSSNNPARALLKDVILASETAANLTRQLLAYAGKGRFVTEPVDMSELVRQISALLQTSIPKNVQLRLELMDRLPCVDADVSQLQQVIMNLVLNAAEAIGEAPGTVLITTGVQQVDENYLNTVLGPEQIAPGAYVIVQVHDTGMGMSQEVLNRIFDPFFTTKFTGRGLGLAAVHGIIQGHRGAIKVYSTPGQGTTFKLLFPATDGKATVGTAQAPVERAIEGKTVLVVDDEQIVRRSAKAMLERYGYAVILAENGKEALELYRVLADKLDVVLLDMTMPEMDGEESFRQMKMIRPDVRVILSSGYNEVEAIRRFAGKGLAGFLQKPYNTLTLVEKVREVMSESRGTAQS